MSVTRAEDERRVLRRVPKIQIDIANIGRLHVEPHQIALACPANAALSNRAVGRLETRRTEKGVMTFAWRGQSCMKLIVIIAVAIISVLVGMGAILPALAQVRDQGMLPASSFRLYTLGIFLVTVTVTSGVWSVILKCRRA